MALADEVLGRYSTQYLASITNPQASGETTYDSTRLAYACTDIEAEFAKIGLTYTDTTATHVATAVAGVVALLLLRSGQVGGKEGWDAWLENLNRLRLVTANDRIMPTTSSELTPSDENPENNLTTRPFFDRSEFASYRPGSDREDPTDPVND